MSTNKLEMRLVLAEGHEPIVFDLKPHAMALAEIRKGRVHSWMKSHNEIPKEHTKQN